MFSNSLLEDELSQTIYERVTHHWYSMHFDTQSKPVGNAPVIWIKFLNLNIKINETNNKSMRIQVWEVSSNTRYRVSSKTVAKKTKTIGTRPSVFIFYLP